MEPSPGWAALAKLHSNHTQVQSFALLETHWRSPAEIVASCKRPPADRERPRHRLAGRSTLWAFRFPAEAL